MTHGHRSRTQRIRLLAKAASGQGIGEDTHIISVTVGKNRMG